MMDFQFPHAAAAGGASLLTAAARTETTTILFTDLVNSTELLQRVGDESAQRLLKAHHAVLRDAVAAHGGQEVKWLGDGLMVAFPSAADAVRCAIAIQQAPHNAAAGERLAIRIGLNTGEALRDESDYFGMPVVIAKRLCDRAAAGQILCASAVAHLLAGRNGFRFRDAGLLELKGISTPLPACAVEFERAEGVALTTTPFVGRAAEIAKLRQKFDDARAGHGALVLLAGEPGIGKTRTADELVDYARAAGARVWQGRCVEGNWAPPYGPFAEAISNHLRETDPQALQQQLGYGAAPLARLTPSLRERLPDLPEPAPLQPDEERFRLFDAVTQLVIAVARSQPLVLVLDDLHWADKGTIALLQHVAHFIRQHRLLIIGTYRDGEIDRQHPLADALAALRRVTEYECITLSGLARAEVGTLIDALAARAVSAAAVDAISAETDGNPFFIREVLLHFGEEGALAHTNGNGSNHHAVIELNIPEGVRQVILRRVARLAEPATRLVSIASAFSGRFRFDLAARVAGLDEATALDAIDAALTAQLIRAGEQLDSYEFTHALIRHTLYSELSPSRQLRIHREIAEAMERAYADQLPQHAAELAQQYCRSAALPGAERGVPHALAAADRAERAAAWDEAVQFIRIALELLPANSPQHPRTLARLGLVLPWTLAYDEAASVAREAARALATHETAQAATEYLAATTWALAGAGCERGAWTLAREGLRYAGNRRDATWARLKMFDIVRREAEDPDNPGIPLDTPERREVIGSVTQLVQQGDAALIFYLGTPPFATRADVLQSLVAGHGGWSDAFTIMFYAGDLRASARVFTELAARAEQHGQIGFAVSGWAHASRAYLALGAFDRAQRAYERARALKQRLTGSSSHLIAVIAATDERCRVFDEGWDTILQDEDIATAASQPPAEHKWAAAAAQAGFARFFGVTGQADMAVAAVAKLLAPIERASGWAANYTRLVCDAADALWFAVRADHADVIERNLRAKVVEPDFRYPNVDARTSLARVCALQGRCDEASQWFAAARTVLDEQGARPLRAIVDYDEALMYARRAVAGDNERIRALRAAALARFRRLGMPGWARRAEAL
ncbi:MAG: AAA family ATPase [Deltaproteobacteria bacterium]|nr:AAA family ATPase [Deltaproteobacteria bacterium]MBI3387516.1 AAA family ATPase [Deltaproteobacteria bacterium]